MNHWLLRGTLGAISAGGVVLLYGTTAGRERVQLDRFTVRLDSKRLPPDGLTILHLSDFHFRADGRIQARKVANLQASLSRECFDVVALTGDLIHDIAGLPAALALIRTLRPRLGFYFVPGNHDYAEYTSWGVFDHTWRESAGGKLSVRDLGRVGRALVDYIRKVARNELVRTPVCFNDVPAMLKELSALGVQPLVNTSTTLSVDGVDCWFAGVDDALEGRADLGTAFKDIPPAVPLVLLAHNPDIWLQCGVERADLVLSGHTHGGQVQIPMLGALHTQGTHLKRSQPAGWFERGQSRMFVSRGFGESIPLRLRARPQVALIHLTTAK